MGGWPHDCDESDPCASCQEWAVRVARAARCHFDGCEEQARNCDAHSDHACTVAAGIARTAVLDEVERGLMEECGRQRNGVIGAATIKAHIARLRLTTNRSGT